MGDRARLCLLAGFVMSGLLLAGPASANTATTATLKCNSQRDQIWVYDSLSTFNVDARLKCGEGVEVIERVKDYVKIRTHNGVEGYVPDVAFADLPAVPLIREPAHDVGSVAKQIQAKEVAKATANAAAVAPADLNYSRISSRADSIVAIPAANASQRALPPSASIAAVVTSAPPKAAPGSATASVAPKASSAFVAAPETTAARPVAPVSSSTASPAKPAASSSEIPDAKPASMDFVCQSYFSAYGLTPNQTKWIARNREKTFSDVCPAPDPSKVDFVIIFTHDVDFFAASMPETIHRANGFSDFTPLTTIDTALVPESQADKARREYVWIFQFEKGTFDPGSFSPHRQYQFSKMETNSMGSKGGQKTVEDAFRFIAAASR
jgi:hypothetical protein